MRLINRTAVTLTGAQPYLDWMRQTDADFNKGAITVAPAKTYGSAFLLPEFELEEDLQNGWRTTRLALRVSTLGVDRAGNVVASNPRLKTFREWFRIDIHSVVVDVGDDDIEGEEL